MLTDADPSRKFKVLAVGPKCEEIEPGDVVMLPGVASEQPDWDEQQEIMVTEDDIGVIVG